MAKRRLPTYCFYVNILIFIGLVYLTYTMRPKLIEGVIETNCCGGIKPGVHYRETDKRPPEYVRRCFKSTGDGGYKWSGFPCTQKESEQCCSGDKSDKCVPSSLGGYCKSDGGDYIYEYKKDKQPYLQFSSDKLLDIDNIIDMKDYFYNRSKDSNLQSLSLEMRQFMARKDENQ
jgi:hypothetical protein